MDAEGNGEKSTVIIKNAHSRIVFESKNNNVLFDNTAPVGIQSTNKQNSGNEIKYEIKNYSIDDLILFAGECPIEELDFIKTGIEMNMRIANVGLTENTGVGMGEYFYKNATDVFSMAKAYTAAASEARMSGYPLPVMSSAGSGNHGLVAIIPIAFIGNKKNLPEEKIIRAVALSHLVTIFVKVHLGALSPVCGCGVAAGVGCAAGLTFLLDGSSKQIKSSINNMVAGISGMLCDGAKLAARTSCPFLLMQLLTLLKWPKNIFIPDDNGILGDTPEKTIMNLAHVSNIGMKNTDE